jgi:hypothetical protein
MMITTASAINDGHSVGQSNVDSDKVVQMVARQWNHR